MGQFGGPGTYDVTFTAAAAGDPAPDNDTLTRAIIVRPDYDIGVAGALDLTSLPAGASREVRFAVTSGPRALTTALVRALRSFDRGRVRRSAGRRYPSSSCSSRFGAWSALPYRRGPIST